jgi:prepilin-type N-terminal cleavage/methylation domain-containing protein
MVRSAFSMIELVFVIVILGILAAVAVPRFASIQDDALISNEKSTIGVARQGLSTLYGKRLARGEDFNITLTDKDGVDYKTTVYFTAKLYPTTLDVKATGSGTDNNLSSATTRGDRRTFALVSEAEALADWNRSAIADLNDGNISYTGPASNTITDTGAEIYQGKHWEYNNQNGKIILR